MASVRELRESLETERLHAAEVAEQSIVAISAIAGLSSAVLTSLAVFVAVAAVFGFAAIYVGAVSKAKRAADSRIATYIGSDEALALIRLAIREEVESQIERRSFVIVESRPGTRVEPAFPEAPTREDDP